jgi:hypothetical protein
MKHLLLLLFVTYFSSTSFAQKEGAVECGLLIYSGTKTSRCFSDEFLSTVQQKTSIATERRFKPVKLATEELFKMPFVILTGEGDFQLTPKERENLKKYVENGGFLLASAGCSNKDFNAAFEREIKQILGAAALKPLAADHAIFRTVFDIKSLPLSKSSGFAQLQGVEMNGKLVVLYSTDGLNDSHHADGCCCCGGNEISNSLQMNANILAYALLH